jgi:drug/metabolite transporter (DMT)-like permease
MVSRGLSPRPATGLVLTIASVVFFSSLGMVTQLAFAAGAGVGVLLVGRFVVAASVLWPLMCLARVERPGPPQILAGPALGVGYATHAWLYTQSLARLDVGLVDLLFFTYPTLVMLGGIALGRDRWSVRGTVAVASAGTALVLAGNVHGIDPSGTALAIGASLSSGESTSWEHRTRESSPRSSRR